MVQLLALLVLVIDHIPERLQHNVLNVQGVNICLMANVLNVILVNIQGQIIVLVVILGLICQDQIFPVYLALSAKLQMQPVLKTSLNAILNVIMDNLVI